MNRVWPVHLDRVKIASYRPKKLTAPRVLSLSFLESFTSPPSRNAIQPSYARLTAEEPFQQIGSTSAPSPFKAGNGAPVKERPLGSQASCIKLRSTPKCIHLRLSLHPRSRPTSKLGVPGYDPLPSLSNSVPRSTTVSNSSIIRLDEYVHPFIAPDTSSITYVQVSEPRCLAVLLSSCGVLASLLMKRRKCFGGPGGGTLLGAGSLVFDASPSLMMTHDEDK